MQNEKSDSIDSTDARSPGAVKDGTPARVVAFPSTDVDAKLQGRPRGVGLQREPTKVDRELAAAGYNHLEAAKDTHSTQTHVDITEYKLAFDALSATLGTSIDTKNPSMSEGLTSFEAQTRLEKDGKNILTPPMKKTAFRKACFWLCHCRTGC